jgi:hypothetical protein
MINLIRPAPVSIGNNNGQINKVTKKNNPIEVFSVCMAVIFKG